MRAITMGLVALGVVALLATSAHGHGGGGYRDGPPTEPPPDSREPSDPPPPPDPPDDFGPGPEVVGPSDDLPRASESTFRTRGVPALKALLADGPHDSVLRAAAAIALARCGDVSIVDALKRIVLDEDHRFGTAEHESAALALGLVGDREPQTRDFLIRVLREKDRPFDVSRPLAAISLGLMRSADDPYGRTAAALLEIVAREEPGADIKPACMVALGLLRTDWTIGALAEMARNGRAATEGAVDLSETETAYAVAALGMIESPGDDGCALEAVEDIVRRTTTAGLEVRRAAAIALGRIGAQCPRPARRRAATLLRGLATDGDADTEELLFAITALGRIGAAPGTPRIRSQVVAFLDETMRGEGERSAPAAAAALGVVGRAICDEGGPLPRDDFDVCGALRAAFLSETAPGRRGAFARASGLARDLLAADALLGVLRDEHAENRLRVECLFAVCRIGDLRALATIRPALRGASESPIRGPCIVAAGLLGSSSAVDDLLAVMRDRATDQLHSAALALVRIGGDRVADGLLAIVLDESRTSEVRAVAISALGRIGELRDDRGFASAVADLGRLPSVSAITALLAIR